jgi:hypothetical protein
MKRDKKSGNSLKHPGDEKEENRNDSAQRYVRFHFASGGEILAALHTDTAASSDSKLNP